MKKLFLGCTLAICGFLVQQASAQDCCPSYQYNACCYDDVGFDGFYVGGNIGVITHTAHRNDLDGFLTDNSGWSTNDTSVTIGPQIGYDWLCGYSLFGLVVDWNWTNIDHKLRDNPNAAGNDNFIKSEFDWFTTIRARAGLTVCDALVYVTLGAAVARFDVKWRDNDQRPSYHFTRWGWTGGVGTEFLVWCNWSLGAEVLFLHFTERTKSAEVGGTRFSFGQSDSAWVGRIILNYRFGDLFSCFCCG